MEMQWCMTLEDCTSVPLIVIVKLVALEGELKIGKYAIIGASLSEPHTSVTALRRACVCLLACGHIPKI